MYPDRNTATYTSPSKNSSTSTNGIRSTVTSYLLLQNGGYLLQQDSNKLIIDVSFNGYTSQPKS